MAALTRTVRQAVQVVMLALGFLLMIGTTLVAESFGVHVPKGYIYSAMAFSVLVLGYDTIWGAGGRPDWIKFSRSYPFVNAGSEYLVSMISERRKEALKSEANRIGTEAVKKKISGK